MSAKQELPEPAGPKKEELWDQIGFHRPLGGFMYKPIPHDAAIEEIKQLTGMKKKLPTS